MSFFTADQIEALAANVVRIDLMAELQFRSQTVRVWNGHYPLSSGGQTWKPLHGAAQFDGITVNGGGTADSVTMTLNGLPDQDPDLLSLALEETPDVVQQFVLLYLQFFSDDWQPQGNPLPFWWGFMQPPKVSRSPMSGTEGGMQSIRVDAENAFFNRSRPSFGRYTDRDQQSRHPGDLFCQFGPSLMFKTFTYPDY